MQPVKRLEDTVASWSRISLYPHRFGGREFRFGNAEVGHVHTGGIVDIPFPRSIRDALLAEGLAEGHRWVPNSGWITFRVRSDRDVQHAHAIVIRPVRPEDRCRSRRTICGGESRVAIDRSVQVSPRTIRNLNQEPRFDVITTPASTVRVDCFGVHPNSARTEGGRDANYRL